MIDKMMPQNMMQPMTPASENSGIASGMMPESSQQEGMQMMQQMAGQMEQVYSGLDNAENIEDVINAMRGNDLPLSERYSELADLVGPEDAKKTPESVLTVLQPVFQTLGAVPDGGIAEAPMGGVEGSEGNFSQPSATEPSGQAEAVLAMSRGEMPVKAATGYSNDIPQMRFNQDNPYLRGGRPSPQAVREVSNILENNPLSFDSQKVDSPPVNSIPSLTNTSFENNIFRGGLTAPEPVEVDMKAVEANAPRFSALYNPPAISVGETDPTKLFESRKELLSDLLPKTRTPEDILKARKDFMGDVDKDDYEAQAYTALAKAGAKIAGGTGGLLEAITDSMGTFAGDLGKIASQKSKQLRGERGSAFDIAEKEKLSKQSAFLSIATQAVTDAGASERALGKIKNDIAQKGEAYGLDAALKVEQGKVTNENALLAATFKIAAKQAGQTPLQYFKINEKGETEYLDLYQTGKTPFYFEGDKKVDGFPPEGWTRLTSENKASLAGSNKLFSKKATPKTFTIFDQKGQPREINGFFDSGSGTYGYKTGKGIVLLDPADGNWMLGKIGENVQLSGDPEGNEYMTTILPNGKRIKTIYKIGGQYARTGNAYQASLDPDDPHSPYKVTNTEVDLDKGGLDPEGTTIKRVVTGSAFLKTVPPSGVTRQMLTKEEIQKEVGNIRTGVEALRSIESFTQTFNLGNVTGFSGSLKTILTGNLAQFLTDDMVESIVTAWDGGKSQQAKSILQLAERLQQQAFILNTRFATTEQEFLRKNITVNAEEFFTDPRAALIKMSENARFIQNGLYDKRHRLDPENNPSVRIDPIPQGTKADPYVFMDTTGEKQNAYRQYDYLNSLAKRGVNLNGQHLKISRFNAKELGFQPKVWSRKDGNDDEIMKQDFIVVPLKTINNKVEAEIKKKGRGQGGR